jgi:signal transduction histidine kinase
VAAAFGAEAALVSEMLPGGRARVVASWPGGDPLPEGRELARDDVLDGCLAVAMRRPDGALAGHLAVSCAAGFKAGPEELAALEILAARAGAELERRRHEALLEAHEAEVAASRIRLVHAADEERRRIGRDLHDGAQQRLVVLARLLDVALRRTERGEDARSLLADARDQVRETAGELRDLARGLHPAGLSAGGLAGALRALAARSPLPLELAALPDRRLPEPVEVTVFYLVSEALANAVKHADATALRVAVGVRGPVLRVELSDDGSGGAVETSGGGLCGLADRLEALGGRLELDSPAGAGTCLRAEIPLAAGLERPTSVS